MEVVLFLAILAATLAFVGWPLFEPALASAGPSERELRRDDLVEEKDRILGALRDLEHDHGTGKIDDADHAALTAKLKADAARVLKEIDVADGRRTMGPGDEVIAQRIEEMPKDAPRPDSAKIEATFGASDTRFCTKCGTAARPGDAFCGRCGNKIA